MKLFLQITFVLACASGVHAQDKVALTPDPSFKGSPTELGFPSAWLGYFPTAKVGDFVEQGGQFGRHREEVLELTKDYIVVARVIENKTATGGKMELRFKYTLSEANKKAIAGGVPAKKPKGKAKEPEMETLKVGDQELKCTVVKNGTITTWYNDAIPFSGIAKKEAPSDKFTVLSFGRGK